MATTFQGKGIVWDAERNKPLCEFQGGRLTTSDPRVIEKLEAMGYEKAEPAAVAEVTVKLDGVPAKLVEEATQQLLESFGAASVDELRERLDRLDEQDHDLGALRARMVRLAEAAGVDEPTSLPIDDVESQIAAALAERDELRAKVAELTTDKPATDGTGDESTDKAADDAKPATGKRGK